MTRLFYLLVMLLVSVPLAGAGATPYSLKDGEGLMGRFVQERHLRGFERPILSEGSFFLLPRASLVWQTELPFFGRMVIDDDGLIQSVDGVEVTRLSFKQFPGFKLLRDTLESSLGGNWQPIEELTGLKLLPADGKYSLRFTPKASGLNLPFAYLNFSIGEFLETVEIVKSNGDRDVITFSEQHIAPVDEIEAAARVLPGARP